MSAGELPGFQKNYLRGLAHPLKATVQVGKDGVTEALLARVDAELELHELVKVKLTRPPDKKAAADELARGARAVLCGLIGHTVILYRRHPKEAKIELPKRVDPE